jgi:D-methionine transport system substrate-binding protein
MRYAKFIHTSLLIFLLCLLGCQQQIRGDNEIILGTIAGPESELMQVAKDVAKKKYNLDVKIITFEDYILPNTALAEGEIDANLFQHQAFLNIVLEHKKYDLSPIAKMFVYPMGIYSKKVGSTTEVTKGSTVGIPNDPSNAARALRLLAEANLISVPKLNDLELTPKSITANPLNLKFIEMGAAQLPRSLDDLTLAIINTSFALPAGLIPNKDAIFLESEKSPYANLLVVRASEQHEEKYQKLINAMHSPEVLEKAETLFKNQAIKTW